MKTKIDGLKFVVLDETGIIDFKNFIIPKVYSEISVLDSFEERMIFAVGATVNGMPLGAIVAQLLETDEVFVHSIMVAENYQGTGIGTELLNAILQIGEEYMDPNPDEDADFRMFVHTDYALAGKQLSSYEAFLRKNGFSDFYDHKPVYIFDSGNISSLGRPSEKARPFSNMDGISQDALEEFFYSQGIYPETSLSFYNGSAEQPDCLLMIQNLEDGIYTISSTNASGEGTGADLDELFLAAIDAITKQQDEFKLVVNAEMNAYPQLWEKYEKLASIVSTHREAGLYIVFE